MHAAPIGPDRPWLGPKSLTPPPATRNTPAVRILTARSFLPVRPLTPSPVTSPSSTAVLSPVVFFEGNREVSQSFVFPGTLGDANERIKGDVLEVGSRIARGPPHG